MSFLSYARLVNALFLSSTPFVPGGISVPGVGEDVECRCKASSNANTTKKKRPFREFLEGKSNLDTISDCRLK